MIYKYNIEDMQKVYHMRKNGLRNSAVAKQLNISEAHASRMYNEYIKYMQYEHDYADKNSVYHLAIDEHTFLTLKKNDVTSIEALETADDDTLLVLEGVGDSMLAQIREALACYEHPVTESAETITSSVEFDPTLSPTQRMSKKPRKVSYSDECMTNYCEPEKARDIIVLYVGAGLGYSPIRHLVDAANDHIIEDIVRQHMFGRSGIHKSVNYYGEEYPFYGELKCPSTKDNRLSPEMTPFVKHVADKYNTTSDDYVYEMLRTGVWKDDPITSKSNLCPKCEKEITEDSKYCRFCGTPLKVARSKKFFDASLLD